VGYTSKEIRQLSKASALRKRDPRRPTGLAIASAEGVRIAFSSTPLPKLSTAEPIKEGGVRHVFSKILPSGQTAPKAARRGSPN